MDRLHHRDQKGEIKRSSRCPAPLSRQIVCLARIYEEILDKGSSVRSLHTLFWGGLVPEQKPASRELPLRLALAAFRSRGWEVKLGKPPAGDVNRSVKDLATSEPIYPELNILLDRFPQNITIASVDKVRVLEAGKLSFYDQLKQEGVQPTDNMPVDCMTWFNLSSKMKEPIK